MRRILPLLILLHLTSSVFSQQIREFAIDTVVFTDQLGDFMKGVGESEMPVVNRFITAWKSDSISYEDKMELMEVSNSMLARRAQPKPDFLDYLTVYMMALSGDHPGYGLDKLLASFNHLVVDRSVPFRNTQRFLSLSVDLLKNRNLYNLAGNNWKSVGGEYRFDHKDFSPFVVFTGTDLYCYSNRDTLTIINTTGKYDLLTLRWSGNGGRVNWEKAGHNPEEVFADLSAYHIEMNRAQLKLIR